MPLLLRVLVVVAAAVAAALLLRMVLAEVTDSDRVARAQPTAEVVMEAMAGLYGVLVAFLLANAWQRYDETRATLQLELNQLAVLQQIAQVLPLTTREQLEMQLQAYREQAILDVQMLANNRAGNASASIIDDMMNIVVQFDPANNAQSLLQSKAFDAITELSNQRRILVQTGRRPLPGIVWVVLCSGAVAVIGVVAVSSRGSPVGAGYLVLLTILLALALYSIYALSYPIRTGFAGDVTPILLPSGSPLTALLPWAWA